MKKYFLALSLLSFIFIVSWFSLPQTTFAQGGTGGSQTTTGGGQISGGGALVTLDNPFSGPDSLFELLKSVMNDIVLPIGGVLAVLAFIYSGFLYVTAQGDETQLKTAHKALLYTAIGTAVLLGSWVLANVICETIGQLGGPACAT